MRGYLGRDNSLPKNRDLRLYIVKSSQEKATQIELWEGTDYMPPIFIGELIVLVRIIGNNPLASN